MIDILMVINDAFFMLLGAIFGIATMALMSVASDEDRRREHGDKF